jgi:hypothetical protein
MSRKRRFGSANTISSPRCRGGHRDRQIKHLEARKQFGDREICDQIPKRPAVSTRHCKTCFYFIREETSPGFLDQSVTCNIVVPGSVDAHQSFAAT